MSDQNITIGNNILEPLRDEHFTRRLVIRLINKFNINPQEEDYIGRLCPYVENLENNFDVITAWILDGVRFLEIDSSSTIESALESQLHYELYELTQPWEFYSE